MNKRNELKLDKKRQRILNLEAELLNYKEIEDLRRREKGKGRALDQDDNDDNIIYNHQDQEKRISHRDDNDGDDDDDPAFAIPRQRARSRQISNKSIEIDDTSLFLNDDVAKNEDFEESLLITQVPDSEGGHHYHQEIVDIEDDEEEDEDAFADLDVILSSSNKTLSMNKSNTNFGKQQVSILSRDPLKEWTNTEKIGKLTSKQDQYGSSSSSFSSTVKDGKKRNLTSTSISNNNNNSSSSRSISNPSEKWADLAIYGKNKNGKNTMAAPAGEKKKARTKF